MFIKYLVIFILAMLPFIELQGAFNIALALNLNKYFSLVLMIISNIMIVPIIYYAIRKLLNWGKDKRYIGRIFSLCILKGEKIGNRIISKIGNIIYLICFIIIALPTPWVGVWLVSILASIFKLDFRKLYFSIITGILLLGVLLLIMYEVIL